MSKNQDEESTIRENWFSSELDISITKEIVIWSNNNLSGNWTVRNAKYILPKETYESYCFYFEYESDVVLFKMRWL